MREPGPSGPSASPPPFRFGVQLHHAADAGAWLEQARQAADLGYQSVHLPDHLGGQFSPIPALAAIAVTRPELRIGTLVLNCALRHPVVLAKELATLDVLSEGRLDVGLGAGWQQTDFDRTGTSRLDPPDRLRRLVEYVEILDALWRGEELTLDGEFYRFAGARTQPRPVQAALPLVIGGGSPRILRFAGARARTAGLDVPQPSGTFTRGSFLRAAGRQAFLRRAGWVREGAGARPVTLQMQIPADLLHLDADPVDEVARRWDVRTEVLRDSPVALVGPVDEVADRLRAWRAESGVNLIVVPAAAMAAASPLVRGLDGR